jgi:hypothetical protein
MGERTRSRSCPWSDYRLMVFTSPSYPISPLIQRPSQSINHPLHLHNLILSSFTFVTSLNTLMIHLVVHPGCHLLALVSRETQYSTCPERFALVCTTSSSPSACTITIINAKSNQKQRVPKSENVCTVR